MSGIRLGGSSGSAGKSSTWELKTLGRIRRISWVQLREGLKDGTFTGVESVRRVDGDWGPLFGRPMYREVFSDDHEPRDTAKARASVRITRIERQVRGLGIGAAVAVALAFPALTGGWLTQVFLLVALGLGIGAGLRRLVLQMHRLELETLAEAFVPPITPPPPLTDVDWAQLAADDEVAASLRDAVGSEGHPEDP